LPDFLYALFYPQKHRYWAKKRPCFWLNSFINNQLSWYDPTRLFCLPSYSPELNPDEYLNCDLKAGVHSGVPARTKEQLKKKAISHLRMLQKRPSRVVSYFKHKKISYAA
ncbi:MAG: transposase, partial [Patescibacteria group bacterium]